MPLLQSTEDSNQQFAAFNEKIQNIFETFLTNEDFLKMVKW